jgi:YidC/Oxa1 family membrane protein insertase
MFYFQSKNEKPQSNQTPTEIKDSLAKLNASSTTLKPADGIATTSVATSEAEVPKDSAALESQFGVFANAAKGEDKEFVIENELQKVTLSTKGGKIKSVELKKYKTWDKKPLILFTDKSNELSYQFALNGNKIINTNDCYFEPVGESFSVKAGEEKSISFRLKANDDSYFEQKYSLKGDSYIVGYDLNLNGLNSVIPANSTFIGVNWNNTLLNLEHSVETERKYSALYYKYQNNEVEHLDEDKPAQEATFTTPVEWISFKQQFFNATLFSKTAQFKSGSIKADFTKTDVNYVKKYKANFTLPYQSAEKSSYNFTYYFGPNHYNTLKATSSDFESIIKLSPDNFVFSWIKYITKWFIIPTFNILDKVGMNYGIIILVLTLLLKLVLTPLTWKAIKSGAYMKVLKPEIDALKEKYGDDQQKIGTEQMKIYNKAGVSPFGGCLPMLLQMPILMSMYYFFPTSIELRQQPFLWATDLTSYDAIMTFKTALPLIGDHISLFTVLMTITSVLFAVYNQAQSGMTNTQPGMQYMPYIMPVMLMFMFNSFPAALTYYYLLQNVFSIAQQWLIQKFFIDEAALHKKIEENKKNPKAKSSWQKKLEEIQKQAEQRQKSSKK